MSYQEEDYLQLSGLQHFAFCRRQWALIHIECLWQDNLLTVEGDLFHDRAHNEKTRERRGDTLILRSLPVYSRCMGISGKCDVVEFLANRDGISLRGEQGLWLPFPVEYKCGSPKANKADELQLCAQAMCLEETLCCSIPEGALYYGETRRRTPVYFTEELRNAVQTMTDEMHQLFRRGHTPVVKPGKHCNACSLKELCLPTITRIKSVEAYMSRALESDQ